jgi:hypothetical protein
MTIIAIIAIISLLSEVDVSIYEHNKHPGWATHRGYHVVEESPRLDHLVRSLTWTCGSLAHEQGSRLLGGPPSAQALVSPTGCENSGSVAGVRPGPVPAEVSVWTGLVYWVVPCAEQVSSAA